MKPVSETDGNLFGGQERRFGGSVNAIGNHFADFRPALAAIEGTAMMGLYGLGAARASRNSFADTGVVNASANANDHGSQLEHLRMIVNNMDRQIAGAPRPETFNEFHRPALACSL